MLKLWGRINSLNVQKVRWTLAELGVAYERIDAGMQFGVVNEPAYRAMNPNGLVPTLLDGEMALWESNAIVRYLAARYGKGEFYPRNLALRADADRWMDWASSTVAPVMAPLFMQLVRTPAEQRNAGLIAISREQMKKLAAILDANLAHRPFVAGEHFTMGDVPLGCFIYRYLSLPADDGSPNTASRDIPNVAAWYARLCARPPYRETVMLPLS